MPVPELTLRDFNRIASGEYNAGQIDFATGENGQVSLTKVNNHVHQTGKNKVTLSAERILEVKEAFVSALRRGGVSDADIAAIRTRLGIPAEMKATSKVDAQEDILRKRFVPLSRNAVREILDQYANNGRGFGEGKMQLSWDELHAAHETAHRSRSTVRKSERTNAKSLADNRTKIDFTFTHALVALKLDKSLGAIDKARNNLVKGPDAANAKASSTTGLLNQYSAFFGQALKMMDPGVHESSEFNLCGQTTFANVVMGALFTGADVAQKMFDDNFTTLEKAKIGLSAGLIATGELGVRTKDMLRGQLPDWLRGDAPDTDTLVMNAIVEDAQKMGGDKSYKIDIGI